MARGGRAPPALPGQSSTTNNPAASTGASGSVLPAGWEEHWDDSHQAYYYMNSQTGESSWYAPEVEHNLGPQPPNSPPALPSGWAEQWDDTHQAYYYVHSATGETSWTKPAQEASRQVSAPGPLPSQSKQPPSRGGGATYAVEDPGKKDTGALVKGITIDEMEGIVHIEKQQGPFECTKRLFSSEKALSLEPDSAAYMYLLEARGSMTPVVAGSALFVAVGLSGAMSCRNWALPASFVPVVLLAAAFYCVTQKCVLFAQKMYFYGNDCTYKETADGTSYWGGAETEKLVSSYLRPVYRLFYSMENNANAPLGKPADVSYEKEIKLFNCLSKGRHTLDVWSGHIVFRESQGKTSGTHVVPTQNLQWLLFSTTGKKFGRLLRVLTLLLFVSVIIGIPITTVSCGGLITGLIKGEPAGGYNKLFGKYDVTYTTYPITSAAEAKVQYADSSDEETKWTNFVAAADTDGDGEISEAEFDEYKKKDQSLTDSWGLSSCRKEKESSDTPSPSPDLGLDTPSPDLGLDTPSPSPEPSSEDTSDGSPSEWRLSYKEGGCGADDCGCPEYAGPLGRRLGAANVSSHAVVVQNLTDMWYSTDMTDMWYSDMLNSTDIWYNQLQTRFLGIHRMLTETTEFLGIHRKLTETCSEEGATCERVCANVKGDQCYSKGRIDCSYDILWQGALAALVIYLLSIAVPVVCLLAELGFIGWCVSESIKEENLCYLPACIVMVLLALGWIINWATDKKKYLTIPIKEGPGAFPGDAGSFAHLTGSMVCAMPDAHELGVQPDDVADQLLPRMLGRRLDKNFMEKIGCRGGFGMADEVSLFQDHMQFQYTVGGKCCGGKEFYYILLQDVKEVVALKPVDLGLKMGATVGILVTVLGALLWGYYFSKCGFKDACTMPFIVGAVLAALCIGLLFGPGPCEKIFRKGIVSVGMKDSTGGLSTSMKYFTFIPSDDENNIEVRDKIRAAVRLAKKNRKATLYQANG